ncbi:MAG: hypothetical protein K8E24_003080 [Methanobacterium paludis]|nr:hypothetical protein [Methanobacterium paludis]
MPVCKPTNNQTENEDPMEFLIQENGTLRREVRTLSKYIVDNWNATYDIGTKVIVTGDDGKTFEGVTKYRAYLFGNNNQPVVFLESKGAYDLTRVRPLEGLND